MTPALAERFEAKVSPEPNSGCWLWLGAVTKAGYGIMGIDGSTRPATHISLELQGSERPAPDQFACHKCDTPSCVNPAHLFWGTHSDNMADQKAKGRHWATLKATCAKGHGWTPENTRIGKDGRKNCRSCEAARLAKKKVERSGGPGSGRKGILRKTHCKHGHEFTPENSIVRGFARMCLRCSRDHANRRYAEMRMASAALAEKE